MKNLKDNFSTMCAVLIGICGGIAAAMQSGVIVLPPWVMTACILGGIIGGVLVSVFQGKNADLSAKSKNQLFNAAKQK